MYTSHHRERANTALMLTLVLLGQMAVGLPAAASTDTVGKEADELADLSLEELMQIEITTFSRKPMALSATPAAVFVVSKDDIARSGARSIPDMLRMVPGVQVAQADASSWAVTARGSNGLFANKLLVLMDGRTLYTPLYSGVNWDLNDTDISAIDRIEVIRGPGATMWGSNAVNGVINIITRKASAADAGAVDLVAGTKRDEGQVAYSGALAGAEFRSYLKYFDRDGFAGDGNDDWDMVRGGVRIDWSDSGSNALSFSADLYSGHIGESTTTTYLAPPYNAFINERRSVDGGFASMIWNRAVSESSNFQLRMSYDKTRQRNVEPNETRETFDIDAQLRFALGERHDIVWGASYRGSHDDTAESFTISFDPDSRTQRLFGAFIQDEIKLIGDELFLTVGTKLEDNSFSNNDLEWEPNVRLSWLATESQTLWASVARAVRVPSRVEQDSHINGAVLPPGSPGNTFGVPMVLTVMGDPDLDSEDVIAYELGYRSQLSAHTRLDLAVFYNHYENIRTTVAGAPVCQPGAIAVPGIPPCFLTAQYVSLPVQMANGSDIDSHGVELSLWHMVSDNWWLQGAYTYLNVDDDPGATSGSLGQDYPDQQFSLRSSTNLGATTEFDLWLRYVDKLPAQDIDSYTTLDARASWLPVPALRVSLVGRNLLEARHAEFRPEFGDSLAVEIEREAYVELRWLF